MWKSCIFPLPAIRGMSSIQSSSSEEENLQCTTISLIISTCHYIKHEFSGYHSSVHTSEWKATCCQLCSPQHKHVSGCISMQWCIQEVNWLCLMGTFSSKQELQTVYMSYINIADTEQIQKSLLLIHKINMYMYSSDTPYCNSPCVTYSDIQAQKSLYYLQ